MSVIKRILIVIAVIVLFRVLHWAYLELRRWVPGVLRRRVTRQADNVIALTERCQTTGRTCSAMGEAIISKDEDEDTYFEQAQDQLLSALRQVNRSCRWNIKVATRDRDTSAQELSRFHRLRITFSGQETTCSVCLQRLKSAPAFFCALENLQQPGQQTTQRTEQQTEQQPAQQPAQQAARMTESGQIEL